MSKRKYNIGNRKAYTLRIRVSANMLNEIEQLTKKSMISKSKFVRLAINKLIAELQNN